MAVDDLSEQRLLVQSAIANLKHSDDAQVGREIAQLVEKSKAAQQLKVDQQQEALQALSRRLQTARGRVEASKAQREQKSHAETMRELDHERLAAEDVIAAHGQRQAELEHNIEVLEAQLAGLDESDVERECVPDETVLKLQILRGLGVEPLTDPGETDIRSVRVWTAAQACVVSIDENVASQQMAAQLWDLCSA